MNDTIDLQLSPPVATVTLDRPEVRNAFNAQMIAELTDAFRLLGEERAVRAVILRGAGKHFSAGADIQWMRSSLDFSAEENIADALRMSDMFDAINATPQPVVARVQGAALGGGMGLVAACDVVVAEHDAVFGFTETKLGIIPAVISGYVLPKIGSSWARALFLTGERFDGDTAQRIGLVHWLAAPDQLDSVVDQKVTELLTSGPQAARAAKALIRDVMSMGRDEVRSYTAHRIAALRTSEEGQEGLRAFLDKRSPAWKAPLE